MAFEQRSLDDYIDVAQRIADFRERYPEGCLQAHEPWRMMMVQGWEKNGDVTQQTFICYTAAAYRTPDDPRPGIGVAWEIWPGRTPYTRGSELQNAETSAWGRAIIAVGASDSKRGIASREEVRNRQAERDDGLPVNRDGSLSRSRTTDEEKDAAGVMTSAQHAEHTQLAKPPPNLAPVEKVSEPVQDVWMDGPAGLAPQDDPEDRPGTATAEQIKSIQTLYSTEFKISDRDKKIETTRQFLKLDMLASHTQLSYRQAGDLLLAMRHKLGQKVVAK